MLQSIGDVCQACRCGEQVTALTADPRPAEPLKRKSQDWCLARPAPPPPSPQPAQPSSLHFQIRKQSLRLIAPQWQAALRTQAPRPCHVTAACSPLALAARELRTEIRARPRRPHSPRAGGLVSPLLGALYPPCWASSVEPAGHKLSTINKTKTSVLAPTFISWCVFFFFKFLICGVGGGRGDS